MPYIPREKHICLVPSYTNSPLTIDIRIHVIAIFAHMSVWMKPQNIWELVCMVLESWQFYNMRALNMSSDNIESLRALRSYKHFFHL